jgi:hypothetical protein
MLPGVVLFQWLLRPRGRAALNWPVFLLALPSEEEEAVVVRVGDAALLQVSELVPRYQIQHPTQYARDSLDH